MPIPLKLDYVIARLRLDDERELLRQAVGRQLSTREARAVWPEVLEHKWLLSEKLGRDVGLRVAAVDYFENVRAA
jgi:hypothetical protein